MKRRRNLWGCKHSSTITTITAGLAREVCEQCGNVKMSYVGEAVRVDPGNGVGETEVARLEIDEAATVSPDVISYEAIVIFEETSRLLPCGLCSQAALFVIPDGLRCDEHAWQAAARLDWEGEDPWVPIRIDRSNKLG